MAQENGFNPRSSHPKDSKMVFDATLLKTQLYKVLINGKCSNLVKEVAPFGVVTIEKGALGHPRLQSTNL